MNRLDILTDALRASFPSPRQLAEACGCTPQSAWRYLRGDYVPNVVTLAQLMRRSPALLAAFIEYVGLDDASLERETARLNKLLAELHERRQEPHASLDQASPASGRSVPVDCRTAGADAQGREQAR